MFGRRKNTSYLMSVSDLNVEITRKKIRNMYIRINRRTGKIRVSCPVRVSDRTIQQFILSKKSWIDKQQRKAAEIPDPVCYEYITGEKHYFRGKEYNLVIQEMPGKAAVSIDGSDLVLNIRHSSTRDKREKVISNFYRSYLKSEIPLFIKKWEPVMNVCVSEFGVKKMKTRWGTCNIRSKRIWLNLALAKKSPGCLESVVVHEMVHLLERLHNKRFYSYMDQFFPEWKSYETELNSPVD